MSSWTRRGWNAMSLILHRSAICPLLKLVLISNLAMRVRKSFTFVMLSSKTCSAGSSIITHRVDTHRLEYVKIDAFTMHASLTKLSALTGWDEHLVLVGRLALLLFTGVLTRTFFQKIGPIIILEYE